jgi:hypothetical protein
MRAARGMEQWRDQARGRREAGLTNSDSQAQRYWYSQTSKTWAGQ